VACAANPPAHAARASPHFVRNASILFAKPRYGGAMNFIAVKRAW
jgi:hypothetical protein